MSSHQAQVPQTVYDYFKRFISGGESVVAYEAHPIITQTFTPGKGWRNTNYRKRVSCSWLRKLAREGVTAVAVCSPYWPDRTVDFSVREALRGGPVR